MFMASLICNMDADCEKLLICKMDSDCVKALQFDTEVIWIMGCPEKNFFPSIFFRKKKKKNIYVIHG